MVPGVGECQSPLTGVKGTLWDFASLSCPRSATPSLDPGPGPGGWAGMTP